MIVQWVHTVSCDPPHRVTHPDHVEWLIDALRRDGWDGPALLGYWLDGRIQLLSGSHRWAACQFDGRRMPVVLRPFGDIEQLYGTDGWVAMIQSPPVVQGDSG